MDQRQDKGEHDKPEGLHPEPGRGAENPLDQRRAHQDRGLNCFPEGDRPEPGGEGDDADDGKAGKDAADDVRSIRSAGEGDLRFREQP